ncbi:DsbA family protein [Acidocella aminolytica]|uniref:Thiol:disulfide interchange protein n=1 Tax=Acidocella aminolytica 101 = DSM 11237 TaxID=1120923 RepID=A0A0D6PCD3_9PROT|nr:DsbA family protein [Acidocella aminolytica]GAN78863.1 thiol:disulfide interchange protein [Acidocella aminolytica 101 = DSM 11237]GBQ39137.1 protein-disulfide isomerase [Acidocella aminolytica 101 = DSM 11237]SHF16849.1 Protein-disulfide isomerase [Acidocella aminolytica 101 = DSM 11237]
MQFTRRSILSIVGASALVPSVAWAGQTPPTETERSIGSPKAPVTVLEFFSLTCPHCAEFGTVTMPEVKSKLVDSGKVRFVYHDFPLDQIALKAAQVSRYLPDDEYYPFIEALFASQNDWAFQEGENYKAHIFKYAALAGMDQATYDKAWNDEALGKWILKGQQEAEKTYKVDATPTFIINGQKHPGAMDYDTFAGIVTKAGG